jgi:hypothetical protein
VIALAGMPFVLVLLLGARPGHSQEGTPPAKEGSVPPSTETPTAGTAPASGSSETPAPNTSPASQTPTAQLPPIVVITRRSVGQKPKQATHKASVAKTASQQREKPNANEPTAGQTTVAATPTQALAVKSEAFNQARSNLLTQIGTRSYDFSQQAIQILPEGTNTPVSKVLLQAPGVTQDSAASGELHIRNEHANVQYRINGIILPDGVSGFEQVLESDFVSNIALITGALPAEYGLRTSGLVDIRTKSGAENPGAKVSLYGRQPGDHNSKAMEELSDRPIISL